MRSRTLIAFAMLGLAFASGCGSRVVLVPETSPIRIGPDARARVYTLSKDGEWELSSNAVDIPEGHYILSPRWVDGDPKPSQRRTD